MELLKNREDHIACMMFKEAQYQHLRAIEHQHDFWKQREKEFWLKDGDRNTTFFHNAVRRRMINNQITRLRKEDGSWAERGTKLNSLMLNYFQNLFTDNDGNRKPVLDCLESKITPSQNVTLLRKFTNEELKCVVFDMKPDKSLESLVKSCYRLLGIETVASNDLKWTHIWKLPIPPKVRNFIWQASTNNLPTAMNLQKKRVQCSPMCNICSNNLETTEHLLISCDFAKECWRGFTDLNMSIPESFTCWILRNMESMTAMSFCLLLVLCWKIWEVRNAKVWNNKAPRSTIVVGGARSFYEAWSTVQATCLKSQALLEQNHWNKPPSGWVKLNTDAAYNKGLNTTGLGFILRNDECYFMAAKEQVWRGQLQSREAEVISIREALKWIKGMNIDHVQVETDVLLVIQRLNNYNLISSFDLVLEDIRKLANDFNCISFHFVKRSVNLAAHLLAKDAVFITNCVV
nr:uncharacterized protein LOC109184133 isoform X1 [Ipomoea batatas]